MQRSCLNCPARMSNDCCQYDGRRHLDGETGATTDCPIYKPLHWYTVGEMLECLKIFHCNDRKHPDCIYCPFYGTNFCEKFLPHVDTYTLDAVIKEFADELPF